MSLAPAPVKPTTVRRTPAEGADAILSPVSTDAASPFRSNRPTAREREEKRAALLLASVRMFNERGFQATSLDDVAASLSVTKPVIYHYLGNKDRVLFECVRIGLAELRAAADQATREPGSGLARLERFLRRYGEIIMGDFGRCVVRTADEALTPASRRQFRALKREIDDALRAMIDAAAADGSARVADTQVAALAIAGALNWSARWYRPDGRSPPAEMAAALVGFLVDGLAATPAR